MALPLRAPQFAALAAAAALAAPAAAPETTRAGGLNLAPSKIEAKVREGKRIPSVEITNHTGRTVFVTVAASPSGQELSGLPRFDLSPASLRAGAERLTVSPPSFRLAPGQRRRVRAIAGARPRGAIASYAVLAFTARPRGSGDNGAVLEPALRLTANLMLRYPGRARIRGRVVNARVEQGPARTLDFFGRVLNTGNLHFEPDSKLTVFSADGEVAARRSFPGQNVLPRAERDVPLRLSKRLPRGNYRARVVTRAGNTKSVRRFAFRLVGPNELAATGLKILSLHTPQPDAGQGFDASVRVQNTGNLAFAPQGRLVLRRHGGAVIAERTIRVDRIGPGDSGEDEIGLPAVPKGSYDLSVRFADGDRLLAERELTFTTGARPALLDRILDWLAGHLPLVLGGFAALLVLVAALSLARVRRLRRRQARALDLVRQDQEARLAQVEEDARLAAEEARLAAQREHELRLARLEARMAATPPRLELQRNPTPKPLVVAGVASVVAFLLGESRGRRR